MRFLVYFVALLVIFTSKTALATQFFLCFGPNSGFEPDPICARSGFYTYLVKEPDADDEENIALFDKIRAALKKSDSYYVDVKTREYRANLRRLSDKNFASIAKAVSDSFENSRIYEHYQHYNELVGIYMIRIRDRNSVHPVDASPSCRTMLGAKAKYVAQNAVRDAMDDGTQEAREATQTVMNRLRNKK